MSVRGLYSKISRKHIPNLKKALEDLTPQQMKFLPQMFSQTGASLIHHCIQEESKIVLETMVEHYRRKMIEYL